MRFGVSAGTALVLLTKVEGAGATNFSTATRDSVPPVGDAGHDMAVVLENWVEKKKPPQQIVATKFAGPEARNGKGGEPALKTGA